MKFPRNARADRRRRAFLKSRLKTPRARDLYRSLISRRKHPDAMTEAHALKIAELVVLAEEARAKAAELLGKVAADKESIAVTPDSLLLTPTSSNLWASCPDVAATASFRRRAAAAFSSAKPMRFSARVEHDQVHCASCSTFLGSDDDITAQGSLAMSWYKETEFRRAATGSGWGP